MENAVSFHDLQTVYMYCGMLQVIPLLATVILFEKYELCKGRLQKKKKNLIGIFQLGSRPPPPPPIGKKNKKKYFICLFHVSEHFKATFFVFFFPIGK